MGINRSLLPFPRGSALNQVWPSFCNPLAGDKAILREDSSLGIVRTEVLCANCHSHLGHVFVGEGYGTPTDQRYCINSNSLRLEPRE
jgi:peptide-methionine (R)-S-oxide reductase